MTTARRKGTAWESAVCRYLNEQLGQFNEVGEFRSSVDSGNVRRQAQTGARDVGDAWAYPFVLEMKNTASFDLPRFIRQAKAEAKNAGFPFGVAVLKKRHSNVKDGYVAMDLETFSQVLLQLRG